MSRAQLTIPDVVFFGVGLAILGAFSPVIYQLLDMRADQLSTGSAFLLQMVVPGVLVTMLIILFAIASGGR